MRNFQSIIQKFTHAGCDSPQREAQILWEYADGDEAIFEALVQRRINREPMSQILGERGFWKHDFIVTKDVLTPRPDSEVLIEEVLKCLSEKQNSYRFLDLGTGSGCLLLTLLHEYSQATGVGVDRSEAALKVAQQNAEKLELTERVTFQQGNWASGLTEAFDLVISNPPYIPDSEIERLMPEVRDYEPHIALEGGEEGLDFYHEIINQAPEVLRPNGLLVFEVGQRQAEEVAAIAQRKGFERLNIRKDYGGVERAVVLRKA